MNTTAVKGAITRVVWPEPNFKQIEVIAAAEGRLVDLWEASPVPANRPPALILGVNCPPKALVRARQDCATALNA